MTIKIGFIGGGNMATSLISGLLSPGTDNTLKAKDIYLYDRNTESANNLQNKYAINIVNNNVELIKSVSILILAVKPQVLKDVLTELSGDFHHYNPLIVSVVAGIRSDTIIQWLNSDKPYSDIAVVRAMPNTPALVSSGASGLYANNNVNSNQKEFAEQLLNSVGVTCWVDSENLIDDVTAISGSGPAYFMMFINNLIQAGIEAGLNKDIAKTLAVATAKGSADLINASELSIESLINNVCSPGGTTEQACQSFEKDNLNEVVARAYNAAKNRSIELGEELSGPLSET